MLLLGRSLIAVGIVLISSCGTVGDKFGFSGSDTRKAGNGTMAVFPLSAAHFLGGHNLARKHFKSSFLVVCL